MDCPRCFLPKIKQLRTSNSNSSSPSRSGLSRAFVSSVLSHTHPRAQDSGPAASSGLSCSLPVSRSHRNGPPWYPLALTLENVAKSEFPHARGGGVPQGIPATQTGTTHSADGPIGHTNNAGHIRVPPSSDPLDLTNYYTQDLGHLCPCPCQC